MEDLNVDVWLNRNKEFWKDLEIHCVVECCGIDAFALDGESIKKSITNYEVIDLKNNLKRLIVEIDNSKKQTVSSSLFNLYENKESFKDRMEEILKII